MQARSSASWAAGRAAHRHGPRPIDVDVLLVGELTLPTGGSLIPHPEVTRRRFVLVPLLELDPALTLPGGTSLREALELAPGQRVTAVAASLT